MKNFMKKRTAQLVAAGLAVYGTSSSAAVIALPATAEADLLGNIGVGGGLAIIGVLAVVGYFVIVKMAKKSA